MEEIVADVVGFGCGNLPWPVDTPVNIVMTITRRINLSLTVCFNFLSSADFSISK
ncbi:MAG: hypothetical protein J1E38_02175 [Paramuribaculum sp.]|nr:hypothetical protein [Paramuribaculum sp.]